MAKRAVGRLGDMVGEEVMLTVEDFKEKGAVGAVKDAVADAGDILIDGVSGIIGWIRGDPPAEEESEKTTAASIVGVRTDPMSDVSGVFVRKDTWPSLRYACLPCVSACGIAAQCDVTDRTC